MFEFLSATSLPSKAICCTTILTIDWLHGRRRIAKIPSCAAVVKWDAFYQVWDLKEASLLKEFMSGSFSNIEIDNICLGVMVYCVLIVNLSITESHIEKIEEIEHTYKWE